MAYGWFSRPARLCLGLIVLAGLQGCSYLRHRGDDAMEMFDIGVTWSKKPYGSGNACLLGLGSIGAGRLDGQFAGIGGGRAGVMRHYYRTIGLLVWSYDEMAWGKEFDPEDPETLDRYHIGPLGWLKYPQRRPDYAFS